ncbi:MAG: Aminomethyltransferase [Turneriella sp.]|nr:Aminomethyltransferase [Turneriella sp.]
MPQCGHRVTISKLYLMKSTPLFEEHKKLNAKFVPFASYNMPVSYGAVKDEVLQVRTRCGMFDVSHMLPISLRAKTRDDLVTALSRICVRVPEKLDVPKAQYNAFYNDKAGLVDDITISAVDKSHWIVVANAGNRDADVELLQKHTKDLLVITPWSNYVLIALQGPMAQSFLEPHFPSIAEMYYYETRLFDEKIFIARMGYTGEDGFEIACPQDAGIALWQKLLSQGVAPCGLAARDVLRLEALMPLYGNELLPTLRPQESGIAFLYMDHESIAPRSIREQNIAETTVAFRMESEGVPRQGYSIVDAEGVRVGVVTSGTFSFTQNYGMGFMRIKIEVKDSPLFVEIRGEKKPITLLAKPPITGSVRRRKKE